MVAATAPPVEHKPKTDPPKEEPHNEVKVKGKSGPGLELDTTIRNPRAININLLNKTLTVFNELGQGIDFDLSGKMTMTVTEKDDKLQFTIEAKEENKK